MANCRKCKKKFPFFTIRPARHPNPLGPGYLCGGCYQPYLLVLEKYKKSLENADSNPKAAVWVVLCCLLAAQRINLVRTLTAVLCGIVETKNSWEVCRQKSIELSKKAMAMLPSDSEGRVFIQGLLNRAEEIAESPPREILIQKYGSVFGDSIIPIEYEAITRSGISMNELDDLIKSLPGHQWLLSSNT